MRNEEGATTRPSRRSEGIPAFLAGATVSGRVLSFAVVPSPKPSFFLYTSTSSVAEQKEDGVHGVSASPMLPRVLRTRLARRQPSTSCVEKIRREEKCA